MLSAYIFILAIIFLISIIAIIISVVGLAQNKKNTQSDNSNNVPPERKVENNNPANFPQQQVYIPPQANNTPPLPKKRHGFLIFFIKLILLGGIVFFTLWNYRMFEINKGWSVTEIDNKNSYSQAIEVITDGIEKIEYYKVPHSCDGDYYKVHISTLTKSYLFNAKESDIKALNALGVLSSNIKPKSVTVIPFYVEVIVGLLVLIIPFRRKR